MQLIIAIKTFFLNRVVCCTQIRRLVSKKMARDPNSQNGNVKIFLPLSPIYCYVVSYFVPILITSPGERLEFIWINQQELDMYSLCALLLICHLCAGKKCDSFSNLAKVEHHTYRKRMPTVMFSINLLIILRIKVVLYNGDIRIMCSLTKCKQSNFIDH